MLFRSLSVHGFFVGDLVPKYAQTFFTEMPQLVATGAIKTKEQTWKGLENAIEALLAVFTGTNEGKVVIVVSED